MLHSIDFPFWPFCFALPFELAGTNESFVFLFLATVVLFTLPVLFGAPPLTLFLFRLAIIYANVFLLAQTPCFFFGWQLQQNTWYQNAGQKAVGHK